MNGKSTIIPAPSVRPDFVEGLREGFLATARAKMAFDLLPRSELTKSREETHCGSTARAESILDHRKPSELRELCVRCGAKGFAALAA